MADVNPEFAAVLQQMLDDWNASNEALRAKLSHMASELARVADINLQIAHKSRELGHRQHADLHLLAGLPKRHNQDAINRLSSALLELTAERDNVLRHLEAL